MLYKLRITHTSLCFHVNICVLRVLLFPCKVRVVVADAVQESEMQGVDLCTQQVSSSIAWSAMKCRVRTILDAVVCFI